MRIMFVDGTKGFTPSRLKEKATGGILTSLTTIPKLLAQRGHEVFVKSAWDRTEKVDGVQHLSIKDEAGPLDVVVFNRNVLNRDLVRQAKATGAKLVWWLHDIVDHRYLVDDAFKHIPNIVSLSDYCTRTYADYYNLPYERFVRIPNGVDKTLFYPGDYEKRDKDLFVFAQAPIKGMKPLRFVLEQIRRQRPHAVLRVYSSQTLHDLTDDALVTHQLNQLREAGAQVLEPVPQEELAEVFREAWLLLMPNTYPEVCSNTLLQAQSCGLPVVASSVGSIPEYLRGGAVTESTPLDMYFWWKEYAEKTLQLVVDKKEHKAASEKAATEAASDWTDIADRWERYLTGEIR